MSRVFESWWWTTIMVGALVFWGGFFPSNPRDEPILFVATHAALALSALMGVLSLGHWAWRVRRRNP